MTVTFLRKKNEERKEKKAGEKHSLLPKRLPGTICVNLKIITTEFHRVLHRVSRRKDKINKKTPCFSVVFLKLTRMVPFTFFSFFFLLSPVPP